MLRLIFKRPDPNISYFTFSVNINKENYFTHYNPAGETFYSYTDEEKLIKINFSIEDIATEVIIKVYKDTVYTTTVDSSDIIDFIDSEILSKEDPKELIKDFKKTKTIKSDIDKSKLDYGDILDFCYIYPSNKRRILYGKSTLVNKKQGITIEYDLWNICPNRSYFYSSDVKFIVLNEPDPSIKTIKAEIIREYYRLAYK